VAVPSVKSSAGSSQSVTSHVSRGSRKIPGQDPKDFQSRAFLSSNHVPLTWAWIVERFQKCSDEGKGSFGIDCEFFKFYKINILSIILNHRVIIYKFILDRILLGSLLHRCHQWDLENWENLNSMKEVSVPKKRLLADDAIMPPPAVDNRNTVKTFNNWALRFGFAVGETDNNQRKFLPTLFKLTQPDSKTFRIRGVMLGLIHALSSKSDISFDLMSCVCLYYFPV